MAHSSLGPNPHGVARRRASRIPGNGPPPVEVQPVGLSASAGLMAVVHHGHRHPLAVTEISLPNTGIDGHLEIPLTIASLHALSYLDLGNNWLHGNIPPKFGNMPRLTQLGLTSNNLTGRIPASIGNLTMLGALSFGNNMLTGPIPEELGKLTTLRGATPLSPLCSSPSPCSPPPLAAFLTAAAAALMALFAARRRLPGWLAARPTPTSQSPSLPPHSPSTQIPLLADGGCEGRLRPINDAQAFQLWQVPFFLTRQASVHPNPSSPLFYRQPPPPFLLAMQQGRTASKPRSSSDLVLAMEVGIHLFGVPCHVGSAASWTFERIEAMSTAENAAYTIGCYLRNDEPPSRRALRPAVSWHASQTRAV
ncbi:hypothetical protein HU200_040807 [Digitaria exilis]|uniref:Uncharacterized protein n=1 Tax=Digitaria exilis TaxID=1010633 RepID=A0A835EFU4_9POAL|nr:hypothetical protein HU200_040807 [Digitaria exilis]